MKFGCEVGASYSTSCGTPGPKKKKRSHSFWRPQDFKQMHSSQPSSQAALPTLMHFDAPFPPSGARPRPSQVVIVSRLGLHMAEWHSTCSFCQRPSGFTSGSAPKTRSLRLCRVLRLNCKLCTLVPGANGLESNFAYPVSVPNPVVGSIHVPGHAIVKPQSKLRHMGEEGVGDITARCLKPPTAGWEDYLP